MSSSCWKCFPCSKLNICLDTVLVSGQSFRWKKNDQGEWLGVLYNMVWRIKQTDDKILFQVYKEKKDISSCAVTDDAKSDLDLKQFDCRHKSDYTHSWINAACSSTCIDVKLEDLLKVKVKNKFEENSEKKELSKKVKNLRKECVVKKETKEKKGNNDALIEKSLLPVSTYSHNIVKNSEEPPPKELINSLSDDSLSCMLQDYFQLNVNLQELYQHWSSKDTHFCQIARNFYGIRILRQDPVENLISFVCSSNNNISRISSMVEKLCSNYGTFIARVDDIDYYTFPGFSDLCQDNVETKLRKLGFGYRAKFIASIAKQITLEKGEHWLKSLREKSYTEAKAELMTLPGVGPKVLETSHKEPHAQRTRELILNSLQMFFVLFRLFLSLNVPQFTTDYLNLASFNLIQVADCVCLMSLDKPEALPIDTHVWQITMKHYMVKLEKTKSLTTKLYSEIGDFYRELWGPYAGWAHSVLFTADLRHNKERGSMDGNTKLNSKKRPIKSQEPKELTGKKSR